MSSLMPYVIAFVIFVSLGGAVATLAVGFSQKNKEGDPSYDRRTKEIFKRLSWYYIVAIALSIAGYIWYLNK